MSKQNNTTGTIFCWRFSQEEENYTVNYIATLVTIIFSLFTCHAIIVMNVLVLVVIKTRHRLQSMYDMLLPSLAGTDLFVGVLVLVVIKTRHRLQSMYDMLLPSLAGTDLFVGVLVLVVIKTRHRLQSMYDMLLPSLTGTDLFVGTITQPTFIAV